MKNATSKIQIYIVILVLQTGVSHLDRTASNKTFCRRTLFRSKAEGKLFITI